MHDGVSKPALIDDIHANPDIHRPEYPLLILFVFTSMVEEYPVQELFTVDLREWSYLNLFFTVAAERCLFFGIPSVQ
jgi:hypothetical protein